MVRELNTTLQLVSLDTLFMGTVHNIVLKTWKEMFRMPISQPFIIFSKE